MDLDEGMSNLRAFAGIMPDIRSAADALARGTDRVAIEGGAGARVVTP